MRPALPLIGIGYRSSRAETGWILRAAGLLRRKNHKRQVFQRKLELLLDGGGNAGTHGAAALTDDDETAGPSHLMAMGVISSHLHSPRCRRACTSQCPQAEVMIPVRPVVQESRTEDGSC